MQEKTAMLPKIGIILFVVGVVPIFFWNHELFLFLNGLHTPWLDVVLGMITGLGDGMVCALLVTVVMLFRLRLGLASAAALTLAGIVTQTLKRTLEIPRPPSVFEEVHLLGNSLSWLSFPSGHSTAAGVMLLLMFFIWKKTDWMTWLVAMLFFLAAYGRIYGGVHFPLDVFVGLAIGMTSMYWCERWSRAWPVKRWLLSEWSWKIPGMMLLIEAAMLGLGYQIHPITAQPLALILSIAALMLLMKAWKGKINHE